MLSSCNISQNIIIGEVQEIYFTKIGTQSVSFNLHLPIENRNRVNLKIIKVELDVFLNNNNIGKITSDDEILIYKRSNAVHEFELDMAFSGANILSGAITLLGLALDRNVEVIITGFITIDTFLGNQKINVNQRNFVNLESKF